MWSCLLEYNNPAQSSKELEYKRNMQSTVAYSYKAH